MSVNYSYNFLLRLILVGVQIIRSCNPTSECRVRLTRPLRPWALVQRKRVLLQRKGGRCLLQLLLLPLLPRTLHLLGTTLSFDQTTILCICVLVHAHLTVGVVLSLLVPRDFELQRETALILRPLSRISSVVFLWIEFILIGRTVVSLSIELVILAWTRLGTCRRRVAHRRWLLHLARGDLRFENNNV